jgi:hypothetical protein
MTTKTERMLLREYAFEYQDEMDTPGHHFNTLVKDIRFPKKTTYSDALSYPYKALPCQLPYAFYLDISQAFSQIASVYGLECSHREGRYMAFGITSTPAIFSQQKMLRALLISGTNRQSRLTEWKNHELQSRQFNNRNYAPMLSRAIYSTLHAVQNLVNPYSVYCHTDGFIIPHWYFNRVTRLLDERHIAYSIKGEGITGIRNIGSYFIGTKTTRTASIRRTGVNNIRSDNAGWWLEQWDRGIEFRGKIDS